MSKEEPLPQASVSDLFTMECHQPLKRFKESTEAEVNALFEARQAKSTKRNTEWAHKIIQDWSMERRGGEINFETIDAQEFGKLLEKFYCEVRPGKNGDLYHRNTIINIRAGINRKLTDLKRNIDVVKDKEFKTANGVLDGLLKERMRDGTAICTKHKDIIEKEDMKKITSYFKNASLSPVILRHCVYFQLAIHFVSRGIEFHCQLKQDSFTFHKDETGEYVTLNPDTLQKNRQSSVDEFAMQSEKRMYATGGDSCPVMMLRLLLEKN